MSFEIIGNAQPPRIPGSINLASATVLKSNLDTVYGNVFNEGTVVATEVSVLLTPNQVIGQTITRTGTAAVNFTLPTGDDLDAAVTKSAEGWTFKLSVLNTGAGIVTLVANTDVTLTGTAAIAAGALTQLLVIKVASGWSAMVL